MLSKEATYVYEQNTFSTRKKSKVKIWVYSLKKNALAIVFCLFCIGLVVFSNNNLVAAKNGLKLWATAVVPSLFPFFVATELLSSTNIIFVLGKYLNFIMRPLFNVPGEASFAFLMGLISGYPVGAKIVSSFASSGICTKEEAERMLSFTNNSGPLFIIGTVGITLFKNTIIGILLFITHLLSCVSVGIFLNIFSRFRYKKYNTNKANANNWFDKSKPNSTNFRKTETNIKKANANFASLGEILAKSITNATSTIFLIGGFVVIFSVVISILNQSHLLEGASLILSPVFSMFNINLEFVKPILVGIIELTNGVNLVASVPFKAISVNIILCAFLLGFGGFSVLLQVFSIVSKANLSIKTYFIGKLLQGLFAAFYTFLALKFIPFLHFNL